MNHSEEQFFERLAGVTPQEGYDAELAKARFPVAETPKMSRRAPLKSEADVMEGTLTVDVYQTPQEIIVESAVAGVSPEDIDIDASTDTLTIRGERRRAHETAEENYYSQECYWGRFSRTIILPQEVDPEGAVVTFSRSGILRVCLPKINRKRSKKLQIKEE